MSRPLAALRALPGRVREDLWDAAFAPPLRGRRLGGDWHTAILVLLIIGATLLCVVNTNWYAFRFLLGPTSGLLLAAPAALAVVWVLYRPVAAWWVAMLMIIVASTFARGGGGFDGYYPWTPPELILQTALIFFLTQLVPLRTALTVLVVNLLPAVAFDLFWPRAEPFGLVALIVAAALGTALRGRQQARQELVVQEELTGQEKARRTLLEERTRIARELHDVVAHHMSVISVQAQVAVHLVEQPSEELKENLANIRANAVDALIELRRVLGVLRSEDASLDNSRHAPQPTLDRLADLVDTVRGAGLSITAETIGQARPLPPGVDLSAYRIVQEALSNAMRHAPGSSVTVELDYLSTDLTISVTNSAPTRPVPPPSGTGHGLLGMRERTAMLGGRITTGPTPDGGYQVTALLPTLTKTPAPKDGP
ncbi:sensor histidine kinase [Kitasatospora sp. NPDC002227]|uniref:sensor histidine kinase n=1 Tax=Kitasatospora sp. NPDC002227 TaxID=3154773 RepID=UPI003332C305